MDLYAIYIACRFSIFFHCEVSTRGIVQISLDKYENHFLVGRTSNIQRTELVLKNTDTMRDDTDSFEWALSIEYAMLKLKEANIK